MSSPVIANCVFATISPSAARGRTADHPEPGSGTVGKSSRGNVCIRESNCAAATSTAPFAPSWMRISVSGRARTISKSFFAGIVTEPGSLISAAHWLRRPTSRSVASICSPPSPFASRRTFPRIGMVFFRSTIPWKSCNSRSRSLCRTLSSMGRKPRVYGPGNPATGILRTTTREEMFNYTRTRTSVSMWTLLLSPCTARTSQPAACGGGRGRMVDPPLAGAVHSPFTRRPEHVVDGCPVAAVRGGGCRGTSRGSRRSGR